MSSSKKISDEFGPTFYILNENSHKAFNNWTAIEDSLANKYALLGEKQDMWLSNAIQRLNERLAQEPHLLSDEWDPIPIDRNSPQFVETESSISTALDSIRSDNGFADTFPDERNETVSALETGLNILRVNSSVHVEYIKAFIIDPLTAAIRRLKDNAAGTAAAVAKGAAIKWLADSLGQHLPDWLRALL